MTKVDLLDKIAGVLFQRLNLFHNGVGDHDYIDYIESIIDDVPSAKDINILWENELNFLFGSLQNGSFLSPEAHFLPEKTKKCYIQMVMPFNRSFNTPICIHFAATGDQKFNNRLIHMAIPLLKYSIGSIIVENPFYGKRIPSYQKSISISTLSDFYKMSTSAVQEGRSIALWLKKHGYKKIGFSGVSMGANTATFAGALTDFPVAISPCLPPTSPQKAFTKGVLSKAINWRNFSNEFKNDQDSFNFINRVFGITDIRRVPIPKKPEAVFIVGGKNDGFVFPESSSNLNQHWKGSNIDWISSGHIGSTIFYINRFRNAVYNSFKNL